MVGIRETKGVSWIIDADLSKLLGSCCIMPPGSWRWLEEPELLAYDFDAQAFLLAAHDVHGGEFAALDTLQHGLARHAERAYRLAHWKKVVAGLAGEAGPEIFGQSDPPRGAGCQ